MLQNTIYLVEAKARLIEWLKNLAPDLLEPLKGPVAWTARESATSMDDLPNERLLKFKVLYFLWLARSYSVLDYLPADTKLSLDDFDLFWSVRRIEVEGDRADLLAGADKYNFSAFVPTGNADIDSWINQMNDMTQKTQP